MLSQEWMLDLITDLRGVAEKQAMFQLAEQLDDTLLIAAREIRQTAACQDVTSGEDDLAGAFPRTVAERDRP